MENIIIKDIKAKYNTKAKDSFKTKLKMFLYSKARNMSSSDKIYFAEFESFKIDEDLVIEYTSVYWQIDRDKKVIDKKNIELNVVDTIYHSIELWENDYKTEIKDIEDKYIKGFEKKFSFNDFETLFNEKKCSYCGITEEEIKHLAGKQQLFKKNERGWKLEIDRINSNFEYTKDNCVMACYWCNNAKTDEFTDKEFMIVGEAIKQIWTKRLKNDN